MKVCEFCGYDKIRITANFCKNCGNQLNNALQLLPPPVDRGNQLARPNPSALALQPDGDMDVGAVIQNYYQDMYLAAIRQYKKDPIWDAFGKHLEAYRIRKKLDVFRQEIEDIAIEHYKKVYQKKLESASDIVFKAQKIAADIDIFLNAIRYVDMQMEDQLGKLPEGIKEELLKNLYEAIKTSVFGVDSDSQVQVIDQNPRALPGPKGKSDVWR